MEVYLHESGFGEIEVPINTKCSSSPCLLPKDRHNNSTLVIKKKKTGKEDRNKRESEGLKGYLEKEHQE
jgi:hypothetical protein